MRVSQWLWRRRRLLIAVSDAGCWAIGLTIGTWFRFDWLLDPIGWAGLLRCILVAVALQWTAGGILQMYRGRYWVGSFDEILRLAYLMIAIGWAVFVVDLIPVTAVDSALRAADWDARRSHVGGRLAGGDALLP